MEPTKDVICDICLQNVICTILIGEGSKARHKRLSPEMRNECVGSRRGWQREWESAAGEKMRREGRKKEKSDVMSCVMFAFSAHHYAPFKLTSCVTHSLLPSPRFEALLDLGLLRLELLI